MAAPKPVSNIQAGGKALLGGSVTTNFSDGGLSGADVGVGLGARGVPPVPVAFSGGIEKTVPVFQGNVKGVVNAAKSSYNAVKNTATKGASAVKQSANKLFDYVKSKF